jgi:undecaprenyl-diphosphatase
MLASHSQRFLIWFGAILFLIVVVIEAADRQTQLAAFDLFILRRIGESRSPMLTIAFINLTALGSVTVLALHSLIGAGFLTSIRDRGGATQLLLAGAASYVCTQLSKSFIERPRPAAITALVEARGFSYPSGHALMTAAMYVTIALILHRHLQLQSQRIVLVLSSTTIILLVALSRVYLGVHYPSDIVSGTLLGTGLAFLIESAFKRSNRNPNRSIST